MNVSDNESLSFLANCVGHNTVTDWLSAKLLLGLLYSMVFIVAVSGNSLVIYVVMSNKNMQTVTNLFITNLALSDLLVNFTSLWLTPVYTYIGHWIWGGWLCYGLPLFQGTSIFISTLTLTSIAIDRYIVIVHSSTGGNRRINGQVCIGVITFIWTLSLLLVMPYAVHMRMTYIAQPCEFWLCIEDWAMDDLKSVYGIIVMSLQFVVPFIVIGFCYIRIWNFLETRQSMVTARRSSEQDLQRKRRLLRMLISMVVIFAACWFPFNALNIMRDFRLDTSIKPIFSFLFLLAHVTSMSATCWNPILYAWMNENFRREFKAALPCFGGERVTSSTLSRMGSQHQGVPTSQTIVVSSIVRKGHNTTVTTLTTADTALLDSNGRKLSPEHRHINGSTKQPLLDEDGDQVDSV